MQLSNRTFIISGGSSGLGLSTALTLLSHDANVSILDLNPPPKSSSHPSSLHDPTHTLFTHTDVSSTSSLQSAMTATVQWCKKQGAPLSGVICCAGIGTASLILPKQNLDATHEDIKYMDMNLFDRTLAINLRGTVDLLRLAIPHMSLNEPWGPDGEKGIAIIVSSVAAYEGQVGQLAYSASKGAVASIVLPLARELGQKTGVRVLGIAPGVFETGMTVPKAKPLAKGNQKAEAGGSNAAGSSSDSGKQKKAPAGARAGINPEMVNYPMRMGKGEEFARLVKEMIENPMLNGIVVRLDGGVRMPSRL